MELRCDNHQLFGKIVDGKLEIACHNRLCGKQRGTVVRHYFDLSTGELVITKLFKDPQAVFNKESYAKKKGI